MKCINILLLCFTFTIQNVIGQTAGPALHYTLLAESTFTDDCLICGRPSIVVPMRGTFSLVPQEANPLFVTYRLENIRFKGGHGTNVDYVIVGSGTYRVGGEVAITRRMVLDVTVNDKPLVFTNDTVVQTRRLPDYVISQSLSQTQQNLLAFYSMNLFATPLREVWFSTQSAAPLESAKAPQIGPGDLLSTAGHIVKENRDLVERLGFMPVVPHMAIDAVEIAPGGEVVFSLNETSFSETLGDIQHGDLVSAEGRIVSRNHELILPFMRPIPPTYPPDMGLDAIHLESSGEILFSVRSNFFSTRLGTPVRRGDLLSDDGRIVRSQEQLLENFRPQFPTDYGLDAVYQWPGGEIWFSTEEGFRDVNLGAISEGDVLSDSGYIALRNSDLLREFELKDREADYGLDALFVVTDLSVAAPPRFTAMPRRSLPAGWRLQWHGPGRVFQLEKAANVTGPYLPLSPIQPDSTYLDVDLTMNPPANGFYRVRQW